jgi:hypothetical protein
MACLRLFTFFPERPLRSVPRFSLCIARATLRAPLFLRAAIRPPFYLKVKIPAVLQLSAIGCTVGDVVGEQRDAASERS